MLPTAVQPEAPTAADGIRESSRPGLHLLVVSHPCITPLNQDFFGHVEAETGWRMTIVLPARWKTEYRQTLTPVRWPRLRGRLLPLPVMLGGSVPLHLYRARLSNLLRRERPDAIYVHNEPYALATCQAFLASRRLGGPALGFYSAQNLLKRYPWPVAAGERYVYRHATFAFPVTEAVAGVLHAKGYRGRSEVLALSVDTDLYHPDGRAGRPRSGGDVLTVGFVGRIAPGKGVETLLEAVRLLPADRVRAVIVGDGPDAHNLRQRAFGMGLGRRLTWTGYVPHEQMPSVYRTMDVLAVPSRTLPHWREQFGRVVIEALACGVPVVTSDSGELPRLVSATGGGWTVAEGDAPQLAALLEQLARRPALVEERGVQGRRAVVRQFAVKSAAVRFAAVVETAVGSRLYG